MSIMLLFVVILSHLWQPTPQPVSCEPSHLAQAVNNAALDFTDGIQDNDGLALTFDVLLERIQELKTACVQPIAEGIHVTTDRKLKALNVGKLADGVYSVTVLDSKVLVVTNNLMHSNSGCTWDDPIPFVFRANNTHTLTAKDCDLQIYTTDTIEMVLTPQ